VKDECGRNLEAWSRDSIERWEKLKTEVKFPITRGIWIGSYCVPDVPTISDLTSLREILGRLKPPRRSPFSNGELRDTGGALECVYAPAGQTKAEFWRASLHGEVFGAQAFPEDLSKSAQGGLGPGQHLSICSVNQQVGAFLAHAARFTDAVTDGKAHTVWLRIEWRGLANRILSAWGCGGDADLDETYKSGGQDEVALWDGGSNPVSISRIKGNLAQLVFELTEDLHNAFQPCAGASTFHPAFQAIREELVELQQWVAT
jgi:hypothetical protein